MLLCMSLLQGRRSILELDTLLDSQFPQNITRVTGFRWLKCYLVYMNHKDGGCGVCIEVIGHPLPPPLFKDRLYIAGYAGWPLSPRNPLVSSFPVLGCQMHTKTPVLIWALGSKSCPHFTERAMCFPSLQGSSDWLKTWDPSTPCLCLQRCMLIGPDCHIWLNKNLFLLR